MAHLALPKSFLDRLELLSVVALGFAFAVLTVALALQGGRFAKSMVRDVDAYGTPSSMLALELTGEQR